jgi:hypothetical protein
MLKIIMCHVLAQGLAYGANGYTGELIAGEAKKRGEPATLVKVPEYFFARYPVESQVVLAGIKDASEILGLPGAGLAGGHWVPLCGVCTADTVISFIVQLRRFRLTRGMEATSIDEIVSRVHGWNARKRKSLPPRTSRSRTSGW